MCIIGSGIVRGRRIKYNKYLAMGATVTAALAKRIEHSRTFGRVYRR